MKDTGIKCKYRFKAGWLVFSKYKCAKAAPNENWSATDVTCNTCKALKWEAVYDCIHFDFAVVREFSDKPEVFVIVYSLPASSKKESWNELKDLSKCPCNKYKKRPKLLTDTSHSKQNSSIENKNKTTWVKIRELVLAFLIFIIILFAVVIFMVNSQKKPLKSQKEEASSQISKIARPSQEVLKNQKDMILQQTLEMVRPRLESITIFAQNYLRDHPTIINKYEDKDVEALQKKLINETALIKGLYYASIVDNKQMIIAHTDPKRNETVQTFFKQTSSTNVGNINYFKHKLPTGEDVINLSMPITISSKKYGAVYIGLIGTK